MKTCMYWPQQFLRVSSVFPSYYSRSMCVLVYRVCCVSGVSYFSDHHHLESRQRDDCGETTPLN